MKEELKELLDKSKKKKLIRSYKVIHDEMVGDQVWSKCILQTSYGTGEFLFSDWMTKYLLEDKVRISISIIYEDYIERQLGL